jgi:hypothetical protein
MESVILLIHRSGHADIIDSFTDEDEARAALTRFVRDQPPGRGTAHPDSDAEAVEAWFATERAFYAISRLTPSLG